jgi:hypothetical protein
MLLPENLSHDLAQVTGLDFIHDHHHTLFPKPGSRYVDKVPESEHAFGAMEAPVFVFDWSVFVPCQLFASRRVNP